MEFTPIYITKEEFGSIKRLRTGKKLSPFSQTVANLNPGMGFKAPCTWKHNVRKNCSGMASAHQTANRLGFKIKCKCREGILYILRKEA
jgi:hypothetical protein